MIIFKHFVGTVLAMVMVSLVLLSCAPAGRNISQTPEKSVVPDSLVSIDKITQLALETRISGDSEIGYARRGLLVSVTPQSTWKSKSGHYCRSYLEQSKTDSIIHSAQEKIACRDEDGIWKQ